MEQDSLSTEVLQINLASVISFFILFFVYTFRRIVRPLVEIIRKSKNVVDGNLLIFANQKRKKGASGLASNVYIFFIRCPEKL